MYGDDSDKWAVVKFKKSDKCKQACQETQGIVLFGNKIKVTPLDTDDFPPGGRDEPAVSSHGNKPVRFEEVDPQATRSLFVGNIPKNISVYDVRDAFQRYGTILDVEIKKMGGTATYGFVLYYDLSSAIVAKKYMDGQNIKGNNIRVGFGKGTNSKQLWVDGVDAGTSRQQLEKHMNKYGKVIRLGLDYQRNCAMVQYDSIDSARKALEAVKGAHIGSSKKLMTDFANRDARAAFFSQMDRLEIHVEGAHQSYPPGPGIYSPGPGIMEPAFRGGMMVPRGMSMMMGRGGYHPPGGLPVDYMYDPYMDGGMGYYGGRPPFHPGRGHPVPMGMPPYPGGKYEDDYEEELAAYKRKRDWDKEREKRKSKKKQSSSSESSSESDDSSHKKRKKEKHKKAEKKQKRKSKKGAEESGEASLSDENSGKRLKTTQKSKEKPKKNLSPCKKSESDSDAKKKKLSEAVSKESDCEDQLVSEPAKPSVENNPKVASPPASSSDSSHSGDKLNKANKKPPAPPLPAMKVPQLPNRKDSVEEEPSCKSPVDEELIVDTPQSPLVKKSSLSALQVESDWSSGEDFKSSDNNENLVSELKNSEKEDVEIVEKGTCMMMLPPREPSPHEVASESDRDIEKRSAVRTKQAKHIPIRYQVDQDGVPRKEVQRSRDPRSNKRYLSGPNSPSPPPPVSGYVGHRRRPRYKDSSPEQHERMRHRRPRPYSPGPSRFHHRHSKSPQRFPSPVFKGKPPSPRPRSPRVKETHVRHRYDSPPNEPTRSSRYSHRSSPRSPSHRHQHSISPPFPRSPDRKRPRHRTPSLSSPRRSPGTFKYKREKSPAVDGRGSSPHQRRGKRGYISRTPSPKTKYRESGTAKEDKSECKRRKMEDLRPKSPPYPPPKDSDSGNCSPYRSHAPLSIGVDTKQSPAQRPVDPPAPKNKQPPSEQNQDNLLDLLRRYPVMWQGHLTLKNDYAAVQLHFLSGNVQLAKLSLPQPAEQHTPTLKIAQRMRLEKTQLEGVGRRIQSDGEHCLLLALPCGRDASDVHTQTNALKNTFITYLIQKQAAGIINVPASTPQGGFVLHIFPPCPFSQAHLSRVAPDLLSSASDNCHLMIVVATMSQ
ncbi:msx2-interacting protein-like isoform X2 [Halichondria panicea]